MILTMQCILFFLFIYINAMILFSQLIESPWMHRYTLFIHLYVVCTHILCSTYTMLSKICKLTCAVVRAKLFNKSLRHSSLSLSLYLLLSHMHTFIFVALKIEIKLRACTDVDGRVERLV